MEWLNIHSATISAPEFVLATAANRGTWLCLLSFCCTVENGGTIAGARKWPATAWPQMCRVQERDVRGPCGLWEWSGDDLLVMFYPERKEAEIRAKRDAGRATVAKRWGTPAITTPQPEQPLPLYSLPECSADSSATRSAYTEGKGREGKGKEEEEAATASATQKRKRKLDGARIPDDPRMVAVGELFGRRPTTPWRMDELNAWCAAGLASLAALEFADDLARLRGYYGLPLDDAHDFRRRKLVQLLNNWPDDVRLAESRAREWNRRTNPDGLQVVGGEA